jgi:hypothetical protein
MPISWRTFVAIAPLLRDELPRFPAAISMHAHAEAYQMRYLVFHEALASQTVALPSSLTGISRNHAYYLNKGAFKTIRDHASSASGSKLN